MTRLLVGGYSPPRGTGTGITLIEHDEARGTLEVVATVAAAESPTALAVTPGGTVVAVQESDPGLLHTFGRDGAERLVRTSTQPSGGADPCHLLVLGRHLLTANYSGGTVASHPIGADGTLGPATDVRAFTGSGPRSDRQEAAHPHMVTARPGTTDLAVADLGSDLVRVLAHDAGTGRFGPEREPLVLAPGTGPRQIVFSADGRTGYVLGELDGSLVVSDWPAAGAPRVTARLPGTAGTPVPAGGTAATLVLVDDGATLLASHRGADVVARFDVTADGPRPRVDLRSGGRGPRHFAVVGRRLYVADEVSDTLTVLDRDTGAVLAVAPVPSPTYVLPLD